MSKWSENYKYKNPDITGIANNLSRIMGIDSGAGGRRSRNLSDLLTIGKAEGQQLKNIGENNRNQAFTQAIDSPELQKLLGDLLPLFAGNPANASSIASGYSTAKSIPEVLKRKRADAGVAEEKLGKGDMIRNLEEQIFKYRKPGTVIPEYMKQVGHPTESELQPSQEFTQEGLAQLAQKLGILRADTAGSGAFNINKILSQAKGAEFKAKEAESSLEEQLLKTKFLSTEQAEELKVLKNKTKLSEKKIDTEEKRQLTEEGRKKLVEERMTLIKDLKKHQVILAKAKAKAQGVKNEALVKEIEAEQEVMSLKIETQQQKLATAKTQGKTALTKGETATFQKDRAGNLASMSKLDLEALPDEIKAKAQELTNKNLKLEEQIKLVQAQTGNANRAADVKIMQKAFMNNKIALQKLLSPEIQKLAKAKADNEVNEFTQQTKNIMLKDELKKKTGTDTIELNPDTSLFDPSTWFNSLGKVNKAEYADISAGLFEHKDKIKSGTLPPEIKDSIIADIMRSLQVDPQKAQKIYDFTISTF